MKPDQGSKILIKKNWTTFKKLHRWPGLIISFVLFYYAVTGILMNHRDLFSGIDLNRKFLPANYEYENWNNAALKGDLIINRDSIIIYGNVGIWLTDSLFKDYTSLNSGFPPGIDNRKTFDVKITPRGDLYAATLFGLYGFDFSEQKWKRFETGDGSDERFTGLECKGDTVFALSRSYLFRGISKGTSTQFIKTELPPPPGADNRITLFQTIWEIHSGEIFGISGKIYVDLLGVITIFLSVTGIIYFFFPGWIKSRIKRSKASGRITSANRWSLRWHNKAGEWTFVLLIILFLTGMFLRPPLLIAIGNAKVAKLKHSHLDQKNHWYDKLRDILYDKKRNILLLSTSDGMYRMDPDKLLPVPFENQPPVSVMGINVFENYHGGYYLIGSFSGLFLWNPDNPVIYNYMTNEIYDDGGSGRPVGDYKITGMIRSQKGDAYFVDYSSGIIASDKTIPAFPEMPENVRIESKISLWGFCLEIHTGRIFESITGSFYILIVPLAGITAIIVVFSGYMLWRRKYRKQGYGNI